MKNWIPTRSGMIENMFAWAIITFVIRLWNNREHAGRSVSWQGIEGLTTWEWAGIVAIFVAVSCILQAMRVTRGAPLKLGSSNPSRAEHAAELERRNEDHRRVTRSLQRPRLKLHNAAVSQLPLLSNGRLSERMVVIATASFYNDPATRSLAAQATGGRAEITIFTEHFQVLTKEHEAYWVSRTKVSGLEAVDIAASARSVEFPSSGQIRELGLVLRFPQELLHSFSSSAVASTGDLHPSFQLTSPRLFVRVRLYAQGVDGDEYWFHVAGADDLEKPLTITTITRRDAAFTVDSETRDDWLHIVISNPVETRDFQARADTIRRGHADYSTTPWWVKWRGKADQVVRPVVTQAELDFLRYELPTADETENVTPGSLYCYSTSLHSKGFLVIPGHPRYSSGTEAELSAIETDQVPFIVEVSSVDPKEVCIRAVLVGFKRVRYEGGRLVFAFSAHFLEDAMKSL